MKYRHQYVIGDLQGCFAALQALKVALDFDETQDCLWFTGDLVARGEDSLSTLREVKRLADRGAAKTVLGNHDLNLLAVWRGVAKLRKKDLTAPIFDAADAEILLNWLRRQPLLLLPTEDTVLTHAGIPPIWTVDQAAAYAGEVEAMLQADLSVLDQFLGQMYGDSPDIWQDDLTGVARLRVITNYLTRMRLCTAEGRLEFSFKDSLDAEMPAGFLPWFDWHSVEETLVNTHLLDQPNTILPSPPLKKEGTHPFLKGGGGISTDQLIANHCYQATPRRRLFGHWAALEGKIDNPHILALDGGCVWGGALLAYRLSDGQWFRSSSGCASRVHSA